MAVNNLYTFTLLVKNIIADIYHLSTPLRDCFFSLLSYSATRFREYIRCCMYRTAILKNDSTAEKRGEKEAFALASIAHCCFVETKTNCELNQMNLPKPWAFGLSFEFYCLSFDFFAWVLMVFLFDFWVFP